MEQPQINRRGMRIAADLLATVGRRLDVLLIPGEDGWWECEYSLDRVDMGGFGHHFASEEEAFVAELAGDLREHGLDEAIWGGWPDCPVHKSHPLDPVLDQTNTAVWQCPNGRIIARIGDLRPR
jgi:hypothetical protein